MVLLEILASQKPSGLENKFVASYEVHHLLLALLLPLKYHGPKGTLLERPTEMRQKKKTNKEVYEDMIIFMILPRKTYNFREWKHINKYYKEVLEEGMHLQSQIHWW